MATAVLGASTEKRRRDILPKIRAAGSSILGLRERENADFCIRAEFHSPAPITPKKLAKYRSVNNTAGRPQKHWGLHDDKLRYPAEYAYGMKVQASESPEALIKCQDLSGLADKFNDIKEAKYASKLKEPLGQSMPRRYDWPSTISPKHIFGLSSKGLENAKEMISPRRNMAIDTEQFANELYKKSHGAFEPGEQKHRNYRWRVNPSEHIFGLTEKRVHNGAANAIHAERTDEAYPKTIILRKEQEDWKGVTGDILGHSKNLGQNQLTRSPSPTYGHANLPKGDIWNAARCLSGEPRPNQIAADDDLGKATKPGWRNCVKNGSDTNRSFGVPTIRHDIKSPRMRSVADYQNYGEEPEAVDLIFPATFAEVGITEEDFKKVRTRKEIKALFERIGYKYKIGKFNTMYNRAKEFAGCGMNDDNINVRHFQMALSELHQIE